MAKGGGGKSGKKKGKAKDGPDAPVAENRRARHEYEILDTLEVGLVLRGTEVKSVRDGNVSIAEGYVSLRGDPPTLTLLNVTIGEYQPAGNLQHRLTRQRTLLAHGREMKRLQRQVEQKGVTIVPLKLYFKGPWAKLLIGVGSGKARQDKRQTIKERDMKRDLQRAMSKRV